MPLFFLRLKCYSTFIYYLFIEEDFLMIRRARECEKELREHMRDGDGTVEILNLATPAELNDKGRLFAKITLHTGCSIGYHVHEKDTELFYILKGEASYSDNGETKIISAGDVTVCPAGTGHSIANHSGSDVELIAVIVYA